MEYKIDSSGERYLIKSISIIIIFIIIIGAVIYFFNNPEYIYKYNISKLTNKTIDDFCLDLDFLKQYSGNFNSDIDVRFNEQDIKLHLNKNIDNKYNIATINENFKIYEADGIFYLEIPEIQNTIKINEDKIKVDINNDVLNKINSNDVKKLYKEFVKAFINELNRDDFYRLSYTYTNDKGKERKAYEYGIRISQERAKEITLNALNKISNKRKVIDKADILIKQLDEKSEITSKKIIEDAIKNVSDFKADKNITYDISTKNSGILNLKVDSIKALCLNSNTVTFELNSTIKDKTANIQINDNVDNTSCNMTILLDNINNSISIQFNSKEGKNCKIDYSIARYGINEKVEFSFVYDNIVLNSQYKIDGIKKENKLLNLFNKDNVKNNKSSITGDTTLKYDDKQIKCNIDGDIVLENIKEDVQLKDIIKINNLSDIQLQMVANYLGIDLLTLRQMVGDPDALPIENINIISEQSNKEDNQQNENETTNSESSQMPTNLAR